MKKVLKYICIFIVTVTVLYSSLVITAKIPRKAIENKINESVQFYKKVRGIHRYKFGRTDTYIHYYADTRKVNVLYSMDTKNTFKSVLWSKYYMKTHTDTTYDFIDLVENNRKPNDNYLRYWNGCLIFLRPLLTMFNIEQIYTINKAILLILAIVLLIMLFMRSKKLSIVYLLSLILTTSWYASYCIEYSVLFYVMFISSIIALIIDNPKKDIKKIDQRLFILFFMTGIVTTFFDFLTTELLTIFIPLIFILVIRKEEKRLGSLKETIIFVIKTGLLWFIGYGLMWLAKWVLASLVLHINAFNYVKDNFALRFSGLQGASSQKVLHLGALERNIFALPFIYYIKYNINDWKTWYIIIMFLALIIIFTDWKNLKNKKFLIILWLFALTPYARYLILANHSYRHVMFTFRDQIITLVVFLYSVVDCLNYKLLSKKIEITLPKKVKK